MYWLRRPPYLRWVAAALLLVAGLAMELREAPSERYPFAAETIPPGGSIESSIDWRQIPIGLLPRWDAQVAGIAAMEIAVGDPILPSASVSFSVPADWWSVAIPLPTPAPPGSPIRLVLDDSGQVAEGVLIEAGIESGFETIGMVAFAPSDAPRVAVAAMNSALVVMIGVEGDGGGPTG